MSVNTILRMIDDKKDYNEFVNDIVSPEHRKMVIDEVKRRKDETQKLQVKKYNMQLKVEKITNLYYN